MATSARVVESEDTNEGARIDKMQEELADYVINTLRVLDEEYGALVKQVEEDYDQDRYAYETRQYRRDESQCLVHDIVGNRIIELDDMVRRWEEKEAAGKINDIPELVKSCQKERAACVRKHAVLQRKLDIEEMRMEVLNKLVRDTSVFEENREVMQEELKKVMRDLENLSVTESIYPSAILEMHTAYNELQKRTKDLEIALTKYGELPPDYAKARDKLTEVQLVETELEQQIRKLIKRK